MKCIAFDGLDKRALHALDGDFTFSSDGEVASVASEMEVKIIRPDHDGGNQFWLTLQLPSGETLDVRMRRAQLLEQLDVGADES